MRYNEFGKTGIKISALGFGCMRFPMIEAEGNQEIDQDKVNQMIQRAYQKGVNYFDTAYFYCGNKSEIALGKALKGIRDKIYVSTKNPGHLAKKLGEYRRILEEQLKKLDMNYVDFYHFHGIGYDSFIEDDKNYGWVKEAQRAKEEGLIRHISFSFHDKAENMIKLIDLGIFESVLCQYNMIDRSNEEAISYAKSKGLGVAVMGPVGGGRISGLPAETIEKLGVEVRSNAELALRFVLANPNIDCALSGMENIHMVEENGDTASRDKLLSEAEIAAIRGMMEQNKKLADLYCTGCSYCMPCPAEINIPYIFEMMNYHRVYGLKEHALNGYAGLGTNPWIKGKKADVCTECGACETRCPQKIQIRRQLKECHETLVSSL